MNYRSIFVSDIHLGSKRSKAELLLSFLKQNTCENLFLVGDIIDGWKIQKNKFVWKKSYSELTTKFLKLSKKINVHYIIGNHDDFLKLIIDHEKVFSNIQLHKEYIYTDMNCKNFLVTHGDMFDGVTLINKYLYFFGDSAYEILLMLNSKINWIIRKVGLKHWSLSKYLKHKVKHVMNFIYQYEKNLIIYCKRKGLDGVICGHIHKEEIKELDGLLYMNDGDWVESCTALVETLEGTWEIIHWTKS